MRTKYHQITLKDTFSDCQKMFQENTPYFFKLLGDTIDISEFIPTNFYHAFYQTLSANSETIQKIDLFSSPFMGELSTLIVI